MRNPQKDILKKAVSNKKTGNFGELVATVYLCLKGYKISERNFSVKGGELDIIAEKKNTVVIVEVKTRTNTDFGAPEDADNLFKKKNIIFAAKKYLRYRGKENARCLLMSKDI